MCNESVWPGVSHFTFNPPHLFTGNSTAPHLKLFWSASSPSIFLKTPVLHFSWEELGLDRHTQRSASIILYELPFLTNTYKS